MTQGCIVIASLVSFHRAMSNRGVVVALVIGKRSKTGRCVLAPRAVERKRVKTGGSVLAASSVNRERTLPKGRVLRAGDLPGHRTRAHGGVGTAVVLYECIKTHRGVIVARRVVPECLVA